MQGAYEGRGGFKPGEYVLISSVSFPFLKIFSVKKKKIIEVNGGLIDVTSESLKIAPGIK